MYRYIVKCLKSLNSVTSQFLSFFILQMWFNFLNQEYVFSRVLLVMVLIYFKRGNLSLEEYTEYNFWTALYIAHDIVDEVTFYKYEILPWALGENWENEKNSFFDNKGYIKPMKREPRIAGIGLVEICPRCKRTSFYSYSLVFV